jgi:hypothetical protein
VSAGGRAAARGRFLRRAGLLAAALVLLTFLFLISGHWLLAVIVGVAAVVAVWFFMQARAVR